MKPLLIAIGLLAPCLAPTGEAWWNKDWKFRRPITIQNRLEQPLEKGFTMKVDVDPDYLGVREKSKAGLEDWALVRNGERVPFLIQPGKGKTLQICFRTAADIKAGASDGYVLYYGAPDATAVAVPHDQVYDFWEDFSRPEALADRFQSDKDLTAAVQDGALVIRDVAGGRLASTPARIAFRNFPQLAGFELSFDLEMDSSDAAAASVAVVVDLKEAGAGEPALGKKVDELIEKLGDDSWENREKATKELIALGRPAVTKLLEAARSGDAEVKWRAAHILKMIQENSPAPVILAGFQTGDRAAPVFMATVIGKNRSQVAYRAGFPVRTQITVQRDPDGDVKVLYGGRNPQSGILKGEIRQVAFAIHKVGAAPLGTLKIDNILVRRFVDDDSRPTSTIDIEETRP